MASAAAAVTFVTFVQRQRPCLLLHWLAVIDLHLQAGCMFHAFLDSQLYICLFAYLFIYALIHMSIIHLFAHANIHSSLLASVTLFPLGSGMYTPEQVPVQDPLVAVSFPYCSAPTSHLQVSLLGTTIVTWEKPRNTETKPTKVA
jgi:hypothetical protein